MQASTPRPTRQSGFALVIALSLMAFVLLLLLSITTLVQVETRSAATSLAVSEARQNALLGLQQALGELQKTAGPDSVATAKSNLLNANPSSPQIVGAFPVAPNQIGVDNSSPNKYQDTLHQAAKAGVTWLVSSKTALADPTTQTIDALNPETTPGTGTVAIQSTYDTAGNLIDLLAGKIATENGAFAWWVDDESQKAKLNITASDTLADGTARTDHSKFTPAATLELIQVDTDDSESVYKPASVSGYTTDAAAKLNHLEQADIPFTVAEQTNWFRQHQNYLTTTSKGLPVDVTHGRLKQDLSYYLETGNGLNDNDSVLRGNNVTDPDYIGPNLTGIDYSNNDLPRFGLMRSWKDIGATTTDLTTGGSPAQARTNTQHGIHPVILRAGIYMSPYIKPTSFGSGVAEVNRGISTNYNGTIVTVDQISIHHALYPRITIWNPNSVPITDPWYLYQASFMVHGVYEAFTASGGTGYHQSAFADNLNLGWAELVKSRPAKHGTAYMTKPLKYSDGIYTPFPKTGGIDADGAALFYTFALKLDSPLLPGESRTFYPENTTGNTIKFYSSDDVDAVRLDNIDSGNVMVSRPYNSNFFAISDRDTPEPWAISFSAWDTANDEPEIGRPAPQFLQSYIKYSAGKMRSSGASELSAAAYRLLKLDSSGAPIVLQEFFDAENDSPNANPSTNQTPAISVVNMLQYENPDDGVSAPEGWSYQKIYTDPGTDQANKRGHQIFLSYAQEDPSTDNDSIFTDGSAQFPLFAHYNPRARYIYPGSYEEQTLGTGNNVNDWQQSAHGERQSIYSEGRPESSWLNDWGSDSNNVEENYGDGYGSAGLYDLNQGANGQVYTLYDFPRSSESVLSLGDLQSVNFSTYPWQPGYAFGNARADARINRDSIINNVSTSLDHPHITLDLAPGNNRYIDLSWLLNHSIWDRFVLSTIPYNNGSVPQHGDDLPNPRHELTNGIENINTANALDEAAQHLLIEGAFNVNTTSVNAWKHFLLANMNRTVSVENPINGEDSSPSGEAAFPRVLYPFSAGLEAGNRDPSNGINTPGSKAAFAANRSISHNEAHLLAQKIVEEVRLRGPFTSLGDFINRRLVSDNDNQYGEWAGLSGTLQTALDRVAIEDNAINQHLYADQDLTFNAAEVPDYLQQNHVSGRPNDEQQSRLAGSPGELTQGDLLRSLGPMLTVRGDTFRIRSYGEYLDVQGNKAQAWCEATVQRIAETVDSNDLNIIAPNTNAYPFGRRFVITKLRWLKQDET